MSKETFKVFGFCRINIVEDGKIVADSGWSEPNMITNLGFQHYLVETLGAIAGSSQVGYVSLGSGNAPAATDTTLSSEITTGTKRQAVTAAVSASKTCRFTATFASTNSFVGGTYNIQNIGLFAGTAAGNTIFAGNTYASSQVNTNQDVNITYEIRFQTAS